MTTQLLVVAELAQGQLKPSLESVAGFARQVCATGGTFDVLLVGSDIGAATEAAAFYGASNVWVADDPELLEPLADNHARIIADVANQRGATMVVAAVSTYSKDVLPRAAALMDAAMAADVVGVEPDGDDFLFRRVMYAGNVIATVRLDGPVKFLTVRAAAFPAAEKSATPSPVTGITVDAGSLPSLIRFVSREEKTGGRPDATEARIVVSGGRAIKNEEDFDRLVGGLADVLGAATGSSRALVDAGITSNSMQIGQTGKIVAPDLYVAVGISGAIQHLAGMKDAKVIVAINKDSDASIFEVADYGLVADVYEAVPELIQKLKS